MLDLTSCPYESDNYLVLDFETTNKNYGSALTEDNSLVLTVAKTKGYYINWGSVYDIGKLVERIASVDFIVAHNAKFELQWLERAGLDLSTVKVYDTMIAEYVINAALNVPLGLGPVAERYGYKGKEPYVDLAIKGGVCPSEIPKPMLLKRCLYDVNVTERVFLAQRKILKERNLLPVVHTRCILTPVLADIEKNGMHLSKERVTAEYASASREYAEISRQLTEYTGGINLNSAKQRAEFIYDTLGIKELTKRGKPIRTAADGRKTDQATVLSLKPRNKQQKDFLELYARRAYLNGKLTKSLNTYKEVVDNDDILLAQFNQTTTVTQRLSSSGANYSIQLQNQPREFKPLFSARRKGWKVGEIDGAQLEFRVAAFLGQDKTAVNDIIAGFDVHSYTAQVMTDAGQQTARQEAKAHTFKPLFGGQSGTDAEQAYYKAFREKYPGIAAVQQSWIDQALANDKVVTITGLAYHYPNTTMSRSGYVNNTTSICNYPVQGFATADIIPIALTYLWHRIREEKLQSFIINTIHDSAVLEIHPDEEDIIREIGEECFTLNVYNYLDLVYNIKFNVPLGTGFKCGEHWTEGEEITKSVEPPFEWLS